jgi:hypothetical protein
MPSAALDKFLASMILDYGKWKEGIGYDLEALAAVPQEDRHAAASAVVDHLHTHPDWRDIEALAAMGERAPLRAALRNKNADIRLRAAEALAAFDEDLVLEEFICKSLMEAAAFDGLSKVLDMAREHPTEKVKACVLEAAVKNPASEARVNIAGLALHLYGKTDDPFDWDYRPLFLRFGAEDPAERRAAFEELCQLCKAGC